MIHFVLAAFRSAGLTDFRAKAANFVSKSGSSTHPCYSAQANLGAVSIQSDAFSHRRNVLFVETSISTMFALFGARDASVDARFELLVSHNPAPRSIEFQSPSVYEACKCHAQERLCIDSVLTDYWPTSFQSSLSVNQEILVFKGDTTKTGPKGSGNRSANEDRSATHMCHDRSLND